MSWVKVWRDSSSRAGTAHYAEYNDEEDLEALLKYYDDLIDGDGFHYLKYKKINKPPIEWITKQITKYSEQLRDLYKDYKNNKANLTELIANYMKLKKD